jgi:DNA-directed RNA polymerase
LKISQKYTIKKSTQVRKSYFKGSSYTIVIPTDTIKKRSQQTAFMPNLIHSLDGSTITLLVKNLINLNVDNLYTIHDCFASTADNISLINELVRESFCQIYAEESYLFNLHMFFIRYILDNNYIIYCKNTSEFITDIDHITKENVISLSYEVSNNNDFISYNKGIIKGMSKKKAISLYEIYKESFISIPNLPETGNFKNIKLNIKKATYLLN